MRSLSALVLVLVASASAGLGGCAPESTAKFEVINKTERPIRVEYVSVDKMGKRDVYSTALLVSGGTFSNGAAAVDRLPGMRARFTLSDDAQGDESNAVVLNLGEEGTRYYNLRLINGRLTAKEFKVSQPDYNTP